MIVKKLAYSFLLSTLLVLILIISTFSLLSWESIAIVFFPIFLLFFYKQSFGAGLSFFERLFWGKLNVDDEIFADQLSTLSMGMGFIATFYGIRNILMNLLTPENIGPYFVTSFHGIFLGLIIPLIFTIFGAFRRKSQLLKFIFYTAFLAPYPAWIFFVIAK